MRLPRLARARSRSLIAILMLTAGLAALLAWEAFDAERSHRATAERAIRDYADFAAWEFAVSAKEGLSSTIGWVFSPIAGLRVRNDERLPSPAVLASEQVTDLLCVGDSMRYHFRLDLRDGSFVTSGETPSSGMQSWIRSKVAKRATEKYKSSWQYDLAMGKVDGRPRTVAYQVRFDVYDKPVALYGFELCVAQFANRILEKVMSSVAVLPPSLTDGAPSRSMPNDSLFSVRVFDEVGAEIFRSTVQYPDTYSGEFFLDSYGLTTKIALNPAMSGTLLIGGLPDSRLPLLLFVLALTVGLVIVGVLQLKREDDLARLRSDFIASVSHELRTPLAQVRMFAETLMLGRVRNEEERSRSLRIVDQEARRLTHLVENILQFSRAERQSITLSTVEMEVSGQVDEVLEAFGPIAKARNVEVRASLVPGLTVMADPGAFRQILLNLLDNAVKYGPGGQTVRLTLTRVDDAARITVDDQGAGVPEKDRERVWLAFQRLDSAVHSAVAGSGIGLSVVAELVALHKGRAWVEDAPPPGRGARFTIELPLSASSLRAPRS